MSELFGNPWLYVLIALYAVIRNLVVSLPKPGDNPAPKGFGSNSIGYQYTYRVLQGITLDMSALGSQFDMRNMRKSFIKSDGTPRINGEETVVIPPKKEGQ